MTGFGAWLVARRIPRVAFIAGFLPLGLFGIVSPAVVVLSAIARGWRTAAADCAIAGPLLVIFALATNGPWQLYALSAGIVWPVAIGLGGLTGQFATLTLPIQVLLMLAGISVVLFTVAVGDPSTYWQSALQTLAGQLQDAGVELANPEALTLWAPLMTGLTAALAVITMILSLLLGAWWAAGAGAPGLGRMFRSLRLGNVVGAAAALAGVASLAGVGPLASDLLLVFSTGFVFQGLAVVHWHAKARRWPWPALLAVYLPMFPILVGPWVAATAWLLLAAAGFMDNWFMLRRGGENMV